MISERTKVALAAAVKRGVKLGRPENLSNASRQLGCAESAKARSVRADLRAKDLAPIILQLRSEGFRSLRQIADQLNARGILSARGQRWTAMAVSRVVSRSQHAKRQESL